MVFVVIFKVLGLLWVPILGKKVPHAFEKWVYYRFFPLKSQVHKWFFKVSYTRQLGPFHYLSLKSKCHFHSNFEKWPLPIFVFYFEFYTHREEEPHQLYVFSLPPSLSLPPPKKSLLLLIQCIWHLLHRLSLCQQKQCWFPNIVVLTYLKFRPEQKEMMLYGMRW